VPTQRWTGQLAKEGFTILPEARQILENFGGLSLIPAGNEAAAFSPGTTVFDPIPVASGEFDRIDYWQRRLGMKLTPIADASDIILLLAEDGRVFGAWCDTLYLWGASFEEALEVSILAKENPAEFARG
jgi:hypothetical protein